MKIQDAISRLSYTISKGHKPNETDKIALNKVIHDLNNNATATVNEHYLFAKLYAIVLTDFIKHYQDVDFANVQINKELSHPIGYYLELLRLQLNQMEMQNYFKSKGVVDPLLNETNHKNYAHLFPSIDATILKETMDTWDLDTVTAHFTNTVNQSILCFKKSL
jgi:hypothetical protein